MYYLKDLEKRHLIVSSNINVGEREVNAVKKLIYNIEMQWIYIAD